MGDDKRDDKAALDTVGAENLPRGDEASNQSEITDFLDQVKAMGAARASSDAPATGRLIFAMDATLSRQPSWDMALSIQAEMFHAVKLVGGLDVQLLYFRGYGECRASKWVRDADALTRLMTSVNCRGGMTQIAKVLSHARQENARDAISAMVYVGDCMEENIDLVCERAGELGLLKIPVFMFQEGYDAQAEQAFREIARLSGGAYCHFDAGAADMLKELLVSVAVYAAGGRKALMDYSAQNSGSAQLLLEQIKS